jgi:hypothetical protein
VALVPTASRFDGFSSDFTNQASSVVDTVLSLPRDEAWAGLPSVFRTLGVGTPTLDPRSRVIGNEEWRPTLIDGRRLSAFLQCGAGVTGPNADSYEVTLQLLVQVEATDVDATLVRTVLDAYARPRYGSATPIHCSSQGTLERRIVALLIEAEPRPLGESGGYVAFGGTTSDGASPGVGPIRSGASGGRALMPGDYVRLRCSPTPAEVPRSAAGTFVGAGGGELTLAVGPRTRNVSTASVSRLQIRDRRARTRVGAIAGGLIGAGLGAYLGNALYSPTAKNHYRRGVYQVGGAILGGIGAAALGAIVGSQVDHDTWIDAPLELLVVQAAEGPPRSGAGAGAGCAALDLDG